MKNFKKTKLWKIFMFALLLPIMPIIGAGGDGGGAGDDSGDAGAGGTDAGTGGAGGQDGQQTQFNGTQQDVNNLLAKERKGAESKFLKDLGLESMDDLKNSLSALKELQDKDKSELEKLQGSVGEKDKALQAMTDENSSLKNELAVLKAGADPAKSAQVLALTSTVEGDSLEAKVAEVLKQFPGLKSGGSNQDQGGAGKGGQGGNPNFNRRYTHNSNSGGNAGAGSTFEQERARIRKAAGLK